MELSNIVGNRVMAGQLAETYIVHIYGRQAAENQKPYVVNEMSEYWEIKGVMKKMQLGGAFEIHIAKNDGRILLLEHSK